jgi:hypothetical protein
MVRTEDAAAKSAPKSPKKEVFLGVLEHVEQGSDRIEDRVRILFKKLGDEWQSFQQDCHVQECLRQTPKNFPASVQWTIVHNTKALATIRASTPSVFTSYSSIGHQTIHSTERIPRVGKPTSDFGSSMGFTPVYRPLVAINQANTVDPEKWSKVKSISEPQLNLRFKEQHPKCECHPFDDSIPKCKAKGYADKQIVLNEAFVSKTSNIVATVLLKCGKDHPEIKESFLLRKDSSITSLGINVVHVDIGDFDADGQSEFLFFTSDYNRNGYLMFYDDFRKKVSFTWSYH